MLSKFTAKLVSWYQTGVLPTNQRKLLLLGGMLLLTAVIGCYYFIVSPENLFSLPPQGSEVAKQDNKIKITSATDLVQKIIYTKCKDTENLRTKPPDNLVGLTYNQVQNIYPGWNIEKFDTKEVEMTLKVDSFCREHANNMFIGIKDGYVAVFYGIPGPRAMVKEITKIPADHLMPQDIQELQQGLTVQSKEELLRTLEGMQAR